MTRLAIIFTCCLFCLAVTGCGGGGDGSSTYNVGPTDTTVPSVSTFTPPNGTTNVPTSTAIEVNFTKPIDPASVNATNFDVRSSNHVIAATYVMGDGNKKVTIKPNGGLAIRTTYTVTVKDAKDSGGRLSALQSWSFTTDVISSDVTPPTTSSFSPGAEESNVKLDATPSVTFSETIDPATANTTNVKMANGSNQITGTVTASAGVVSFKPTSALIAGQRYTVTYANLKDLAGNTMQTQFSWSFTTGTATGGSTSSGPTNATVTDPKGVVAFALTDANTLIIWVHKAASASAPKPFIIGTFNSWQKAALPAFDSNGWSSITVTITQPVTIAFTFGYDYGTSLGTVPNGSETWASDIIPTSNFYKTTPNNLQATVANSTVTVVP